MHEIIKCPVCGKEKKQVTLSDFDCDYCGFTNAFVRFFSSKNSYNLWKESVKNAVQNLSRTKRHSFSESRCLKVGNNAISFRDVSDNKLLIALGNGKVKIENDAIEFDSSERNYAILYKDGTVEVFGDDNELGQKNTDAWSHIRHVVVAPNCTYGVTESGEIVCAGSPADMDILNWKNISTLKSSDNYIVGLCKDGSIVLSENAFPNVHIEKVSEWRNIKDVVPIRDGIVGLTKEGTVLYLGKLDDPRKECTMWKEIIAIEADNAYVYGLSQAGKVYVAGNCKKLLDKGRKDVGDWENVMIISCNKAGIGAINEAGEFLFAGTITGDKTKIINECNKHTNIIFQGA